MNASIEIKGVTKKYGGKTVLDKVNLSIANGEFLVLLGPSGCGKTTLLRCVAGLEKPEDGEICIGEEVVFSSRKNIFVPPGKRRLGMVFQSYALWPHMTVFNNIGFGLRLLNLSKIEVERKVLAVLKSLDMDGLSERYPSELSGGQQQRVAVARLLATSPSLFLMDEPLSNLDARLRVDMRSELKRLHKDMEVTTVYVTHDQTEALTMSDRIVILKDGIIQQAATPSEIYNRPANLFSAEFMAMPKINVLKAFILREPGNSYLKIDDFLFPIDHDLTEDKVTAVVRPEDIKIMLEPEPGAIDVKVYSVLPSGPESYIQVKRNGKMLLVRHMRQFELEVDQSVWIKIDPASINLYSNATQLLL